jgi:acetylornithine/succinyldiaminopimelate/putrescine aminotransferase
MKIPFQNSAPKKYNLILIHNQSGNPLFHYACINEQTMAHNFTSFDSLEEILKKADKKIPFIIHVRGAGVLARSVENAPNYKERLLVSGREDEFYFNSYERSGSVLVSFARKNVIDEFLSPILAAKAFIWALYIGPSILPFKLENLQSI